MNTTGPYLSVVIPVYNESGNILPLASEIASVLERRIPYEIIFVDDCSSDATAAEIAEARQKNALVRSCRHDRNRGQSAAVRTGVKASTSRVVAVIDGDGQHDPKDLINMYGRLTAVRSLNMVIGERVEARGARLRRILTGFARAVRSAVLDDGVRDAGCGIKVFYRDQFLELPAFDHMHRFLPALVKRGGGKVSAMPVRVRPRRAGASKYSPYDRARGNLFDLFGVWWLLRRQM